MPQNILYLSFDVDGCIFHRQCDLSVFLDERLLPYSPIDHEKFYNSLIDGNPALFEKIDALVTARHYDQIVIALGSLRQDIESDMYGMSGNRPPLPSAALVTSVIQLYLEQRYPHKAVKIDPILSPDLFSHNGRVGTYQNDMIQNQPYSDEMVRTIRHEPPNSDDKFLFVYAQLQRAALLANGGATHYVFFDDRASLLYNLSRGISDRNDNLPKATVEFFVYAGRRVHAIENGEIKTTGSIDQRYQWTVRWLATYSQNIDGNRKVPASEAMTELHKLFKNNPNCLIDGQDPCFEPLITLDRRPNMLREIQHDAAANLPMEPRYTRVDRDLTTAEALLGRNHDLVQAAHHYHRRTPPAVSTRDSSDERGPLLPKPAEQDRRKRGRKHFFDRLQPAPPDRVSDTQARCCALL